ncbi:MAG: hypothetical protein WKF37_01040 [Bryobacteraceae bacterium]
MDRTIAAYHIPHYLKATWIYELPLGQGKLLPLGGVVNTLFGGWQVSGIHQLRSGNALSISTGGLQNPFGAVYPDLVAGQPIVINSDAPIEFRGRTGGVPYLNRAAFATRLLTSPIRTSVRLRGLVSAAGMWSLRLESHSD